MSETAIVLMMMTFFLGFVVYMAATCPELEFEEVPRNARTVNPNETHWYNETVVSSPIVTTVSVRDIESEILSKVESMNRELLRRVDEAAGIVQLTAVTE